MSGAGGSSTNPTMQTRSVRLWQSWTRKWLHASHPGGERPEIGMGHRPPEETQRGPCANRTAKNITSVSVVECSTQEMQRASALQTSQSLKMSSKIQVGGATTATRGICSGSPATAGMQPKFFSTVRTPEKSCVKICPRLLKEGRAITRDRSERGNIASLCEVFGDRSDENGRRCLVGAVVIDYYCESEGGIWCDSKECYGNNDPSDGTVDRPEVPRQSASEQQ